MEKKEEKGKESKPRLFVPEFERKDRIIFLCSRVQGKRNEN